VTNTAPLHPFSAKALKTLPPIDPNIDFSQLTSNIPLTFLTAYSERHYIPFTHLTEERLTYYALHPPDTSRKISFEDGTAGSETFHLQDNEEVNMPIPEYDEAARNFLRIVEIVTPARLALWETHFNFIKNYTRRIYYHTALVKYCITKRTQNLAVGEDPSVVRKDLLLNLCSQHDIDVRFQNHDTTRTFVGNVNHRYEPYSRGAGSSTRGRGRGGRNTHMVTMPMRGTGNHRGSDHGWGNRGRGHSFRPSDPQASTSTQTCMVCGETGHWANNCQATSQFNGKPLHISRASKGELRDPGGNAVCFHFNRGTCSAGPSCSRVHTCAGCGASDHTRSDRRC
jgi:hypothetical protein